MDKNKLAIDAIVKVIDAGNENSNVADQVSWVVASAIRNLTYGELDDCGFSAIVQVAAFVLRNKVENGDKEIIVNLYDDIRSKLRGI